MSTPPTDTISGEGDRQRGSRRAIRWWPAVTVVLGSGLLVGLLCVSPDLPPQTRNIGLQLLLAASLLLLFVWWVLFSRGGLRSRFAIAATGLLLIALLGVSIRRVGVTGDLWLDVVWRWSSPAVATTNPRAAESSADPVDLAETSATDFPQFLGPHRDAKVHDVPLSRNWSRHRPTLLWRQPIGSGWSSFAIVNQFAVTQQQLGDSQSVVCYELTTGNTRWTYTYKAEFHSMLGGDGPRATPTVDGGEVFTLGPTGVLNHLRGEDGTLIWSRNVLDDNDAQNKEYGLSGSPLVVDDLVVVSAGGTEGKSLVAYDRRTGKIRWQGGNDRAGYSSPALATLSGVRQILVLNHHSVASHDPRTGKILWRYDWPGEEAKVPQPAVWQEDRLFVSSGFGAGCELLRLVVDASGMWHVRSLWRNRNMKPKFTNVVIRGRYVYGLDNGILACLDLTSGKRQWKRGRYRHGQVLLVDDLLLVQAEFGDVVLVEARPDRHHELCRFAALDDRTWNNPALSGRYLLVRNNREAACYELPLEKP